MAKKIYPLTWNEFQRLPHKQASEYLNALVVRFGATCLLVAKMMGCSTSSLTSYNRRYRLGVRFCGRRGATRRVAESKEWKAFLAGSGGVDCLFGKRAQMCWSCQKTDASLCSWFDPDVFVLPKGVKAERREVDGFKTAHITSCPKFEYGSVQADLSFRNDDAWIRLAESIVAGAIKEYKSAINVGNEALQASYERFLQDHPACGLVGIDAGTIISRVRGQAGDG